MICHACEKTLTSEPAVCRVCAMTFHSAGSCADIATLHAALAHPDRFHVRIEPVWLAEN